MGKRIAVEYQCDRCQNTWYEDWDQATQKPAKVPASLSITMGERKVHYDVLCATCTESCTNYVNSISKDLKRKPGAKKKGESAEAPSPPQPPPAETRPEREPREARTDASSAHVRSR